MYLYPAAFTRLWVGTILYKNSLYLKGRNNVENPGYAVKNCWVTGLFRILAVTFMVTAPCIESFVHRNLFYTSLRNLFFKQSMVLASRTRIRLLSRHTRTKYNQHLQVKVNKEVAVPLQAWSGPEGSRKLRFPDFMTTAQEGGKVVSLTHRPHLLPGNPPGTHFC